MSDELITTVELKTLAMFPSCGAAIFACCVGGRLGRVETAFLGRAPPQQGLGEVLRRLQEHQQAPAAGEYCCSICYIYTDSSSLLLLLLLLFVVDSNTIVIAWLFWC